jgi:hypothetical protein
MKAGTDMIEYRVNLIDKNGRLVRAEILNSSDDVAAMTAAEKLVDASNDVVVWHQNRLLVRLSHGSKC